MTWALTHVEKSLRLSEGLVTLAWEQTWARCP